MLISVISDTHLPSIFRNPDGLGPELGKFLSQTDLIIHAGDVVRPSILDWCEQFAPVKCAKGNNDEFDDPRAGATDRGCPTCQNITLHLTRNNFTKRAELYSILYQTKE